MSVNDEVLQDFRELAQHNAPWVLASAVCNATQLGRVMTRAQAVMTGRTLVMFDDRQQGLDWLVTQSGDPAKQDGAPRSGEPDLK